MVAVGGTIAMLIGPFGPWATAFGGVLSRSGVSGDSVDGWIIFVIGLAAALLVYRSYSTGKTNEVVLILLGIVGAGVGLIDLQDVASRGSGVDVGWGLLLCIAGGVAVALSTAIGIRRSDP